MSLVLMPLAGESLVQRADRKVNSLEPKGENDRWNKRMQFASSRSVIIQGRHSTQGNTRQYGSCQADVYLWPGWLGHCCRAICVFRYRRPDRIIESVPKNIINKNIGIICLFASDFHAKSMAHQQLSRDA